MSIDIQKLLSEFDAAATAHGWASDIGTAKQAQVALSNYQLTRSALERALDAQAAEIDRLERACRVAVMALAHATQEHGKVYESAYQAVSDALFVGSAALSGEGK